MDRRDLVNPAHTVAQITDLHFGGPAAAAARVDLVLDHLMAMEPMPDLLLVTGDIADHGLPAEYDQARAALARWPGPMLVGIGNHDVRDAFTRGLLGREPVSGERLDQVLDLPHARFLMLDSLISAPAGERIDPGEITEATLAWLGERLAEDARPTYVCLHHPPVEIGVSLMDPVMLRAPRRLEATLREHSHHAGTLVGHAHTQAVSTFAGKPLLIGGGVASTVPLGAEPLALVWEQAPPSFAVHLLGEHGHLITHWRSL
ncbi:metallophosphoesterase [Nocardioides sp.]|uniref:metallophosphoesterase n=1 Tax=Nocardioides sp. TaxID=35761 RepID=UPI003563E728